MFHFFSPFVIYVLISNPLGIYFLVKLKWKINLIFNLTLFGEVKENSKALTLIRGLVLELEMDVNNS